MSKDQSIAVTDILKCLSCPYRLQIVLLLRDYKKLCVCDFMMIFDVTQPKISRYLSDLRKCGILTAEKKAQWVYYQFAQELPSYLFKIIDILAKEQLTSLPKIKPLVKNDCLNQGETI